MKNNIVIISIQLILCIIIWYLLFAFVYSHILPYNFDNEIHFANLVAIICSVIVTIILYKLNLKIKRKETILQK